MSKKSDDLRCIEACELYDMLDWFFMAQTGGERIVNINETFSGAVVTAINNVYDRAYQQAVNDLTNPIIE